MTVDACAALVQRGDPDRFMACMAAPVTARQVLFPIYAFNLEVARAPWVTAEPLIAEMRLQWWADVLDEIAGGGPVRRHEVVTPLAETLDPKAAAPLRRLVAARRGDITGEPWADDAALWDYVDATSADLAEAAALALGSDRDTATDLRPLARASGLANLLRAAPALAATGRSPLRGWDDARLAELAREALAGWSRPPPRGPARPVALAFWQAPAVLRRAIRDPGAISRGALELSEFRRRWGLIRWRLRLR